MPPSATTPVDTPENPGPMPAKNGFDRFFKISERGSTVGRELRGGLATFFAMAYIIVLNPIILGAGVDKFGHHLDNAQLVTATALMAGLSTVLMGLIGNVPIAIAAGLGINAVVSLQLAPKMSWPDAMGMVVLAGLVLMLLVASGLRQRVMDAIPNGLRRAIAIGIGLFISLIGLVDGFVTRNPDAAHTTVPMSLGQGGQLKGWPVLVFVLGLVLMFVLIVRKVRGAILIGMVTMAVVAIGINALVQIPDASWGLAVPNVPDKIVDTPDFGLIGQISLFGGFKEVGVLTGCLFVFTVLLSGFFDAMGTIIGVGEEAGLLNNETGQLPNMGRILMVDGIAVAGGGFGSASANTCFVESTAGVGEGARTGLANLMTGGLFLLALIFTPLATVVPSQAATPALVVVGFLIMASNVRDIDWGDPTIGIPAFLTMVSMPFTYSITNGIGIGVLAFILLRSATGRVKEIPWLLNAVGFCFLVYFLLDPIEQVLGVK